MKLYRTLVDLKLSATMNSTYSYNGVSILLQEDQTPELNPSRVLKRLLLLLT